MPGTSASFREEKRFGGLVQQPVAVIVGQEIQPLPDEADALRVFLIDNLERTVAFPHAAVSAVRLDDALDDFGEAIARVRRARDALDLVSSSEFPYTKQPVEIDEARARLQCKFIEALVEALGEEIES